MSLPKSWLGNLASTPKSYVRADSLRQTELQQDRRYTLGHQGRAFCAPQALLIFEKREGKGSEEFRL